MKKTDGFEESPLNRPLKVYAFDPSHGRSLGNHMTVNVRNEELAPGPVGSYLEVIDYDVSNDCYYQPVDLSRDDTHVVFEHFHPGLVAGDTSGWDVFARDTTTGVTRRISVTPTGGAPNGDSFGGAVNGDGSLTLIQTRQVPGGATQEGIVAT